MFLDFLFKPPNHQNMYLSLLKFSRKVFLDFQIHQNTLSHLPMCRDSDKDLDVDEVPSIMQELSGYQPSVFKQNNLRKKSVIQDDVDIILAKE